MKLATPAEIKKLTCREDPAEQFQVLSQQLGLRPILIDGKIRIYQSAIETAMAGGTGGGKPSKSMNLEAFK